MGRRKKHGTRPSAAALAHPSLRVTFRLTREDVVRGARLLFLRDQFRADRMALLLLAPVFGGGFVAYAHRHDAHDRFTTVLNVTSAVLLGVWVLWVMLLMVLLWILPFRLARVVPTDRDVVLVLTEAGLTAAGRALRWADLKTLVEDDARMVVGAGKLGLVIVPKSEATEAAQEMLRARMHPQTTAG